MTFDFTLPFLPSQCLTGQPPDRRALQGRGVAETGAPRQPRVLQTPNSIPLELTREPDLWPLDLICLGKFRPIAQK